MDFTSQCTFWCSVLSDNSMESFVVPVESSQCTFWCSVLSDEVDGKVYVWRPKGSQCTFWCSVLSDLLTGVTGDGIRSVSMHLLVLSAFRPARRQSAHGPASPVSMHLLVLSAFRP